MTVKDFKKTDIYKKADAIEFINKDGEEISFDSSKLIDMEVISVNKSKTQVGLFEVTVIPENEIYNL